MNKAVFLDRDGVINKTVFRMGKPRAPYLSEEYALFEGVPQALQLLKQAGFLLIVVTNQPDVARGWVSRDQVDLINNLVKVHLPVDEIYACFHTEKDLCQCRKPKPGMLLEASKKWNIDFSKSFMIGDRSSDIEAGLAVGCRSILVGEEADHPVYKAHFRAEDLLSASGWILKN